MSSWMLVVALRARVSGHSIFWHFPDWDLLSNLFEIQTGIQKHGSLKPKHNETLGNIAVNICLWQSHHFIQRELTLQTERGAVSFRVHHLEVDWWGFFSGQCWLFLQKMANDWQANYSAKWLIHPPLNLWQHFLFVSYKRDWKTISTLIKEQN